METMNQSSKRSNSISGFNSPRVGQAEIEERAMFIT